MAVAACVGALIYLTYNAAISSYEQANNITRGTAVEIGGCKGGG